MYFHGTHKITHKTKRSAVNSIQCQHTTAQQSDLLSHRQNNSAREANITVHSKYKRAEKKTEKYKGGKNMVLVMYSHVNESSSNLHSYVMLSFLTLFKF
jgi:hypothetical protein